jgi:probable addiction module antidote protein
MNGIETRPWDIAEHLDSDEMIAAYLSQVFEDGDAAEIRAALGHVARAKGMAGIAADAGITREALYRALGKDGNPTLDTLLGVVKALGVRLTVTA